MKKKIWIISIPIILLLLGLVFYFTKSEKPSDLANAFEKSIQNEDSKTLYKLVALDKDIHWTHNDAKNIIKYLKKDQSDLEDQLKLLHAQASYYESNGKVSNMISQEYPGESITNIGPFYIKREKSIFGDKYVLKARGYKVQVETEKDAKLTFDGIDVDSNKEYQNLGYYGPGVYSLKGSKKYDYTTVDNEKEIVLFDPEDFDESVSLDLSGETINVSSEIPHTKLIVNGKVAQDEINEEDSFGPVADNITIQGASTFPWGEGKSKEIKVKGNNDDEYDITPSPIVNDDMKNTVKSLINSFAKNRVAAKEKKNISLLKNVSDNLRKEYNDEISTYDDQNYYQGKALGTRIDFSKASYEKENGGKEILSVPVEFHTKSRNAYEFINSDVEDKYDEEIIGLEYNPNKKSWVIDSEESDYSSGGNDYMSASSVEKTTF
ncbi:MULTISPECIES: TcaA 3rd/4th domain-containing protein [Bacillus subtilis group]|uniref:TcaA 3rd/4th domain-containing protein n=1 Tax=Bacillus subtilis group TaxID=653685 RepID=UPI0025CAFAE2|nr:hypothetical protein [Bacillus subtilis]GLI90658.1 hypothetical protein ANABIO4_40100 [Bacillus subtilis]